MRVTADYRDGHLTVWQFIARLQAEHVHPKAINLLVLQGALVRADEMLLTEHTYHRTSQGQRS
jgi:hypothetical protein